MCFDIFVTPSGSYIVIREENNVTTSDKDIAQILKITTKKYQNMLLDCGGFLDESNEICFIEYQSINKAIEELTPILLTILLMR